MIVRDGTDGVEVFMLERNPSADFGGLYVFPGGKLDEADAASALAARCHGFGAAEANRTLGFERDALAFWVAAIRECFEEAGILLARGPEGDILPLTRPERRERFAGYRKRLNARDAGVFEAMCEDESLTLGTDSLAYVAHWVTPKVVPRRYDTRFFVARAPADQHAIHDGGEAVESLWVRPEDALARFRRGELEMISPTFTNLEALTGYASADALLADKRTIDAATIETIRPAIREGTEFEEDFEVIATGGVFDAAAIADGL